MEKALAKKASTSVKNASEPRASYTMSLNYVSIDYSLYIFKRSNAKCGLNTDSRCAVLRYSPKAPRAPPASGAFR